MAEKMVTEELRVKELLQERGVKMKEMAEQINITPESLSRALNGNPQYSTLKKVADYLNVNVRDLFRGDDEVKTDNEMRGSLYFKNEMFVFNSRKELENFLKENK